MSEHSYPERLDELPPCAHCGSRIWCKREEDGRYLCICYWHPELRQQKPVEHQPKTFLELTRKK